MLRRVHEQRAVGLLYGQRALCIGAVIADSAQCFYELLVARHPAGLARRFNTRSFEMVAGTERRRIERGRPTPQIGDGDTAGRPAAEPSRR